MNDQRRVSMHAARRLETWLAKIPSDTPLAVILGGTCNALSFARSLGRRRIPTLMLESDRFLGTYTHYSKVILLPALDRFAQEWLDLLEFVGSRLPAPGVLFPTGDFHTLFVSRYREALQRYFRFLVPDLEILERIVNKRSQYEAARAMGVPIPEVSFPDSFEEASLLATAQSYPCLLKPYTSEPGRRKLAGKLVVVHSKAELIDEYDRITGMNVPLMIQEFIPGKDSALYGYLGFWDTLGVERAWVTKQKLRQYPSQFGDGSMQITVEAPRVAELSRHLLKTLSYRGFVGIEFKLDERYGTYRLIEINPRTVSGNQLAISAGIDFPWIGYQYLTGSGPEGPLSGPFRRQVKYVNEEWDVQAYLSLRKSRDITFRSWLDSLRGVQAWAFGAWDDPLPLLAGLWRVLRRTWSRIAGKPAAAPRN